jgi:threonine dehydrogenase-like Zn-dependent dehydrogenase
VTTCTARGADQTVQAVEDRSHVQQIRDLTGGAGANVVIDFVGEGGAERDAVELLGTRGVGVMVGYGGSMEIEILSQALFPETSFLGSIVGTYNEAVELIALCARGDAHPHHLPAGGRERRPAPARRGSPGRPRSPGPERVLIGPKPHAAGRAE